MITQRRFLMGSRAADGLRSLLQRSGGWALNATLSESLLKFPLMDTPNRSLALLALVVRDYDEAIAFFTGALRFTLVEDTPLAGGKRWVVVAPRGGQGAALLLAKAATTAQLARVGDQTGGRVFLFLHTSNFQDDYSHMQAQGVRFAEEPREEEYGRVAVFLDLYGNKWDLLQPRAA